MASPEAQALHERIRQFRDAVLGSEDTPSVEEQRRTVATNPPAATRPEGVSITEDYAGGCRAFWHDPAEAVADRVVLYLHGGGYVLGSPRTHERVVGHIAIATGCRALILDTVSRQNTRIRRPSKTPRPRTAGCSRKGMPPNTSRSVANPRAEDSR